MKKKTIIWWGAFVVIAIVTMLLFSARTSPLYSLLLGDYSGNEASSAMLIGKYWLHGEVPYIDLFATGGPLYFAIQAVGWFLGGRTGIFILQIINFTLFLVYMQKILKLFVSENVSGIITVSSVILYLAFCAGGNSSSEWCLTMLVLVYYVSIKESVQNEITKKSLVLIGWLCGAILQIHPISGGIVYGSIMFILFACKEKGKLRYMLLGLMLPILPTVLYFTAVGGMKMMIQGAYIYPLKLLAGELLDAQLLIRKAVKCFLVVPLLTVGIYKIYKKEMQEGLYTVLIASMSVMLLMCADNSWDDYIAIIPCIVMGLVQLIRQDIFKFRNISAIVNVLLVVGISFIPVKNYVTYLIEGVPEISEEFYADMESFYQEDREADILMIDTDNSYYLMIDKKPICRFITEQTELTKISAEARESLEAYLSGTENADILITTEHGWIGQDFENFSLVQVYIRKGGNICVYAANN